MHQAVTDPDARMTRKSFNTASVVAYHAGALVDNRHGLLINTVVSSPHGRAVTEDTLCLLQGLSGVTERPTVGAEKRYGTRDFVDGVRAAGFTSHEAEKAKGSAIDGRTTRHDGYTISHRARKRIKEVFGWLKTGVGLRKVKHRGTARVDWIVTIACEAYNLVRLRRLLPACPWAGGSFTCSEYGVETAKPRPRGLTSRPLLPRIDRPARQPHRFA